MTDYTDKEIVGTVTNPALLRAWKLSPAIFRRKLFPKRWRLGLEKNFVLDTNVLFHDPRVSSNSKTIMLRSNGGMEIGPPNGKDRYAWRLSESG